jgi:AbrB family looped-hinge helix DNA binding protein
MEAGARSRHVEITRLSTRGQLVIPKSVRTGFKWQAGDYITVEVRGDHLVLRKLSMDDVLEEADREWEKGKTVRLWPKEE